MTTTTTTTIKVRHRAADWIGRGCAAFLVIYLCLGLVVSCVMAYAVPSTNLKGRAYLAAFWPAMIKGSPFKAPFECGASCFTFKKEQP